MDAIVHPQNMKSINQASFISVLMICKKESMLEEIMKVTAMLWNHGFIVHYDVLEKRDSLELQNYCTERGIIWRILFPSRKAYGTTQTVQAQNLMKKTTHEIEVKDLVSYLLGALKDSEDENVQSSRELPNARIIFPDGETPLRAQLKSKYIKTAQISLSPMVESLDRSSYSIFIINLDILTIRNASTAFQKNQKVFMDYLQSLSSSEKAYLEKAFSVIRAQMDSSHLTLRFVFIWSSTDKKSDIIYI
jgi:hypothetical protein